MRLAVAPEVLSVYLAHVCDERPMRELARALHMNPTSIMRRVHRVEALREAPEWSEVLDALEAARSLETPEAVTPALVLDVLGVTRAELLAAFVSPLAPLADASAVVATAPGLATAIVTMPGQGEPHRLPRRLVLAAVALGWLRLASPEGARLRTFAPVPAEVEAALRAMPEAERPPRVPAPAELPAAAVHRRNPELLGRELLAASQSFSLLWELRDGAMAEHYGQLREAMPPRLFRVLERCCGERIGVEALEYDMGLPARSGKVILAAALDVARHSGALV